MRVIDACRSCLHVRSGFHHREHRDGPEGKKGSEPDPKPFLSGLCGLFALCGETPDRAIGRKIPRESWLAPMAVRGWGRYV